MYRTAIYCKCEHCNEYFEVTKRRKYCSRKCRDAHYYDTKGRVNIEKRYKAAQKEAKEWRKPFINLSKDKSWQNCVVCSEPVSDGHDHEDNLQEFTLINAKCMVYGHDYKEDGTCERPSCGAGL
jgi:CRISPR/Cas system-associated protein Cas10 (large subunit of type III CRISPR-Cas system)